MKKEFDLIKHIKVFNSPNSFFKKIMVYININGLKDTTIGLKDTTIV